MKSVVSLSVGDVWVGIVGDEELDDVEVAVACCPLHWGGDEISSKGVDFCALFEEVTTGGDLSVDGCPVEWSDVLFITVCRFSLSGFDELSKCMDVAPLCCQENVDLH